MHACWLSGGHGWLLGRKWTPHGTRLTPLGDNAPGSLLWLKELKMLLRGEWLSGVLLFLNPTRPPPSPHQHHQREFENIVLITLWIFFNNIYRVSVLIDQGPWRVRLRNKHEVENRETHSLGPTAQVVIVSLKIRTYIFSNKENYFYLNKYRLLICITFI